MENLRKPGDSIPNSPRSHIKQRLSQKWLGLCCFRGDRISNLVTHLVTSNACYPMKIAITIEDTEDGQIKVSEQREPGSGETEEMETASTALADAMFAVMDQLGEVEE